MLKGFFRNLGKMPCTLVILAGIAVLTVLAGTGKDRVYAGYSYDAASEPSAAIVLRAAKDGVYPWGTTVSSEEEAQQDLLGQLLAAGEAAGHSATQPEAGSSLSAVPAEEAPVSTPADVEVKAAESVPAAEPELAAEEALAAEPEPAAEETAFAVPENAAEETAAAEPETATEETASTEPETVEEAAAAEPETSAEETAAVPESAVEAAPAEQAAAAEEAAAAGPEPPAGIPEGDVPEQQEEAAAGAGERVFRSVLPAGIAYGVRPGRRAQMELIRAESVCSTVMETASAEGAEEELPREPETAAAADEQEPEPAEQEPENPTYVHADSMPEDVNSPVMDAVDYGNADRNYLSAADTVYNTDVEGLFAQNGDYYRFRDVNDVYFSDALIIGDSRTVGLRDYGGMRSVSAVIAKESLNVFNLFTKSLEYTDPEGNYSNTTLLDLLLGRQYRKVYLCVGINELGIGDTMHFYNQYRQALGVIRQLQPDAIIYIQGIMHVSGSKSRSDRVFNNTLIVQRNRAISTLANGHDIFYIDMNPEFCDSDGNVYEELTGDGIHLKASAYDKWHTFLLTHGIVRNADDYLGTGPIMEGVSIPGVTEP